MKAPLAILGAAVVASLGLAAGDPPDPPIRAERLPGVSRSRWIEQGYVELVPAIRPPTSVDGRDRIEVWLKLPPGGLLETRPAAHGIGFVVALPAGSVADRVELDAAPTGADARVVDVRGTTFLGGDRQEFHVLRAFAGDLHGFAWDRGDPRAQEAADDALEGLLRRRTTARANLDRNVARLRRLNDCSHCHGAERPETEVLGGSLPSRATDASGLHVVLGVLESEGPIEVSRPVDPNLDDPYVGFWCAGPSGPTDARVRTTPAGGRSLRCDDGRPPRTRLDVRAALAEGDAHANAVCASRRHLFAHLDALGREAFAASFAECAIAP